MFFPKPAAVSEKASQRLEFPLKLLEPLDLHGLCFPGGNRIYITITDRSQLSKPTHGKIK
jgi:hypothetical protein